MVERDDVFRVTEESRGEHLSDWSDEQLLTLHDRQTDEAAQANEYLGVIEEILAERQGVDIHQARLGNPEE